MSELETVVSIADNLKVVQAPSAYWPESANVYLIEDGDGVSFFDVGCGSIDSAERLFSALKALKWESRPVKKVILSHAHPDHMGAMEILLSEVSPGSIMLHEIDVPYALEPEKLSMSFDIPLCKEHWSQAGGGDKGEKSAKFDLIAYFRSLKCAMCRVEPDRTMAEGDVIKVGNYRFRVFHTPGHAPGHVSLYDPGSRVLLSGDILGEMVAWYAPTSGGAEGYLRSLEKIRGLDIDLILPAHGGVITDAKKVIFQTTEKIVERDSLILGKLQTAPRSFEQLIGLLFETPFSQFFPGTPVLESHLRKLIKAGTITTDPSDPNRFCLA